MRFNKPKRKVSKVFIHCSDSDIASHDNIETIRKWHVQGKGWSDIGYHFFITKNGNIQTGRNIKKIPSAQKGHNARSIAICLSGKSKEKFTQEQFESLKKFCKEIKQAYDDKITFHGHCEVSKKTCPVFDYKKELNLDSQGYIKFSPLPNLLIKTKKKMSPLIVLAAPLIKKLAIKGWDKLKGKVQEKIVKEILEKTGIDLGSKTAQSKIDNLSPKQLLELRKEIINSDSELLKAELENQTKQIEIINKTMKAEIKADDFWQRRWRPFNGFMFGISMTIFFVSFIVLGFNAVSGREPEMVKMIAELVFSFLGIVTVWGTILGISSYSRGKEKLEKLRMMQGKDDTLGFKMNYSKILPFRPCRQNG